MRQRIVILLLCFAWGTGGMFEAHFQGVDGRWNSSEWPADGSRLQTCRDAAVSMSTRGRFRPAMNEVGSAGCEVQGPDAWAATRSRRADLLGQRFS